MAKSSEHELRFVPAKEQDLQALVYRLNCSLAASRIADPKRRSLVKRLIHSGKLMIGKIVPYVRRPRTLTELLFGMKVKEAALSLKREHDKTIH